MGKLTNYIIPKVLASIVVCITSFAYECVQIRLPPTPANFMELFTLSLNSAFPIFIALLFICYYFSSLLSRYLLPTECRFCFFTTSILLVAAAGFLAEFLSRRHADGMEVALRAGIRSAFAFVLIILPATLLLKLFDGRIGVARTRD